VDRRHRAFERCRSPRRSRVKRGIRRGRRIGYSARLRVDRRDFGLTFNQGLETGGVLISNEADIEPDIEAVTPFSHQ
jgi:hypothetical protein